MTKKEIADKLKLIQAASISDVLDGICGIGENGMFTSMSPEIKCRVPGCRMAGTAFTVLLYPFDNTSMGEAVQHAKKGDVIVAASPHEGYVSWGELFARRAVDKGIAGMVTNGATRDLLQTKDLMFPQFTKNISVKATFNSGRKGALNIPILIGGIIVRPGDWIVGDDDGVVAIPAEMVMEVIEKAKEWDEGGEVERAIQDTAGKIIKKSLN